MPLFDNEETHPSFGVAGFSRISVGGGGIQLFDSSVPHQHYIELWISTAKRQRGLHRDWITSDGNDEIVRIAMSEAQFGALVSSFGQGGGVPVTISRRDGALVPAGPHESRLAVTAAEVAKAADKATEKVQEAVSVLVEACLLYTSRCV